MPSAMFSKYRCAKLVASSNCGKFVRVALVLALVATFGGCFGGNAWNQAPTTQTQRGSGTGYDPARPVAPGGQDPPAPIEKDFTNDTDMFGNKPQHELPPGVDTSGLVTPGGCIPPSGEVFGCDCSGPGRCPQCCSGTCITFPSGRSFCN